MTTSHRMRNSRLMAIAFAVASTSISFASTLELLSLQSGPKRAVIERSFENLDL